MSSESLTHLITDTESKDVACTPELEAALPGVYDAFLAVDAKFDGNELQYLRGLEDSSFSFKSSEGSEVACSLIHSESSRTDEILLMFAPFADRGPKTSAVDLYGYINSRENGFFAKERVAPNSWNQTTKSAVIHDLLQALGHDIPVLTIYSPIPTKAYSKDERKWLEKGYFTPAGRLAKEALNRAQTILHGDKGSQGQIRKLHVSGASLGASNAVGATASNEITSNFDRKTLTVQELIMGPRDLRDLGNRFALQKLVGNESQETQFDESYTIREPILRQAIDKDGSETIGTAARTIRAAAMLTYMRGLTNYMPTREALARVINDDVGFLAALAVNSALTHQTPTFLPNGYQDVLKLVGKNGQKLEHIVDEHVACSATVIALNIASSAKTLSQVPNIH